jgi:imidazolonepropionase-like amidohydrolase
VNCSCSTAPRSVRGLFLIAALSLAAAAPARAASEPVAVRVGRLLTMDDADTVFAPGMVISEGGKLTYVGPPIAVPEGVRLLDWPAAWAAPGMVDLHTHVHTGGWGDLNDMVLSVNPELRAACTVRPSNQRLQLACAAGVTTLFAIPGSGTNISGFGVLYKSKLDARYEETVLADPGGMKVAQDSNPQRRAGDFGLSRAAMGWILEDVTRRAQAALDLGLRDPALANLMRVLRRELPVLIHTAGSEGVVNSARMWRRTFDTRSVVSHGSFDGWKAARAVADLGMPVNHGPRTIDYFSSRNGRINGSSAEYVAAGVQLFSLNTDSGVIPQEEFFLQGSMSARYGGDARLMLRALTTHPAKAFGIDQRVGSLEVGKDADLALRTGDPLDPRSIVELVLIEGEVEYDRRRDGTWF